MAAQPSTGGPRRHVHVTVQNRTEQRGNAVSYRKLLAGVALVAGLGGAGIAASAPSLVVGSTATAGAPMICWDRVNTCPTTPPTRPPLVTSPDTTTTTTAG
jgi:hypothetical protein